jgi:protein-S-isoprenylcysteine O-methyltransferase Ste14
MSIVTLAKIRREAIPLLFFGTVVSTKLYFLADALFVRGGWARLVDLIGHAHTGFTAAAYLASDILAYIFYNVVAILFDALVFYSYLIRHEPVHRATGFWETVYPLATVLLPVTGFTLLTIPAFRELVPTVDPRDWVAEGWLSRTSLVMVHVGALAIGALGAILSFTALWTLRRSFSLMTEIRELVTTGLYKRVRHPLYMAEIIHVFGIAILSTSPVGLALFVVAVTMQVARAKIEERKFLQTVPDYGEFMQRTGFLWPKLWQGGHSRTSASSGAAT